MRWEIVVFAALGLLLINLLNCEPTQRPATSNLLLITIDTLRADALSVYGSNTGTSPTMDSLADRSTVFLRAYSTAPFTGPSHASILTSQSPSTHGILYNGHRHEASIGSDSTTVAQHLSSLGFTTAAFVSAGPLDAKYGFSKGFHDYTRIGRVGSKDLGGPSALVTNEAIGWLKQVSRQDRFFLWVHYFDPHLPYVSPMEIWDAMGGVGRSVIGLRDVKNLRPDVVKRGYSVEVYETDRQIKKFLQSLEGARIADNTVIALVADHGEYLFEHGLVSHSKLYDEVLHVPMIIHSPGQTSRVLFSDTVSTIDLVPTLLTVLDITEALPLAEGRDLFHLSHRDSPVFSEWRNFRMLTKAPMPGDFLVSAQVGDRKYIKDVEFPEQSQLFSLATDPGELQNLRDEEPEALRIMEDILGSHLQTLPNGLVDIEGVEPDQDTKKMLRELGYLQ